MRGFALLAALLLVGSASGARRAAGLPLIGLAVDEGKGRVELRSLDGAVLRRLAGSRLDGLGVAVPGVSVLRDRNGRRWVLDGSEGLRAAPAGIPLRPGTTLSFGRVWSVRRGDRVLWRARARDGLPNVSQDRGVVSVRGRALDVRTGRFVALPQGCAATDRRAQRWILLCDGRSYAPQRIELWSGGRRRLLAAKPFRGGVGHWIRALLSPDGERVLAQWSAECEVPIAFLGSVHGPLRAVAAHGRDVPTSGGLGWTRGGQAVVELPEGACGGSVARPGVYLVAADGRLRLAVAIRGIRTRVALWGD